MRNVRAAWRYAQALMSVAEERHEIEAVAKDIDLMGTVLSRSRELRLLVASPVIREGKKQAVFQELFGARVGRTTISFMNLLLRKRREIFLPDVIKHFHVLRDEKEGIVVVDVACREELTGTQRQELLGRLEQYTGKKVRMRFTVDQAIKGGLVVRIGDTVLDVSVRRQLERIRECFLEGGSRMTSNA
jgi:F-type H+-transporting ATPase subunit delta